MGSRARAPAPAGRSGTAGPRKPVEQLKPWTEAQIVAAIAEKKLAPRDPLSSSQAQAQEQEQERETECPICFCDYDSLNSVLCCNQLVCTSCYVNLRKPQDAKCACPFCEKPGFLVAPADAGSSSSTPKPAFRSRTTTPTFVPTCSKADRQTIEREISATRSSADFDSPRGSYTSSILFRDLSRSSASSSSSPRFSSPSPEIRGQALREHLGRLLHDASRMGPGGLGHVNEVLLLEAIRQSLEQGQGSGGEDHPPPVPPTGLGQGQGPPLPFPPPDGRDRLESAGSVLSDASSLTEEEQLQLAISLSLRDEPSPSSSPPAAPAPGPGPGPEPES